MLYPLLYSRILIYQCNKDKKTRSTCLTFQKNKSKCVLLLSKILQNILIILNTAILNILN